MLECVINISEGRRLDVVELVARNAGRCLLDVHLDPDHHRSVLTIVGEPAARAVAAAAVMALDLTGHDGVHPRLGVLDVVPFVPLGEGTMDQAVEARDRFARWLGDELGVPCFLYGPASRHGGGRELPEVRREAFGSLAPDFGPTGAHPTAGATAVGARPVLVAYNVWLATADRSLASQVARELRGPAVRALGLSVGGVAQVSMNLIDPVSVGPADVYDKVRSMAPVARAELVGLVPRAVLTATPEDRWEELDLGEDRTIEGRLALAG